MNELKAPYVYFGAKHRVAPLIWKYLGDVPNYIEPFCGSLSNLLCRPTEPKIETASDANHFISNFWRAIKENPEEVAKHANFPSNECDLHARNQWLMQDDNFIKYKDLVYNDPEYYNAKIAGWWVWGMSTIVSINSWCGPKRKDNQVNEIIPNLTGSGGGIHANPDLKTDKQRLEWLNNWFSDLSDRLRNVRVCCGDWQRCCNSESSTTSHGITGIFLDPPYSKKDDKGEEVRCADLYANDKDQDVDDLVKRVRAYCLENGKHKKMRIVLAGYEGEGHNELEENGWNVIKWSASGGYANKSQTKENTNRHRERLWVSPHCVQHKYGLFDQQVKV